MTIVTEFIVGFPTETHGEFLETLNFIAEARFDTAFPYAYHDIPGTIAYTIDNKIDEETIKERITATGKFFDKQGISWLTV